MRIHYLRLAIAIAACSTVVACADDQFTCPIQLVDVTDKSGIAFQHTNGGSGEAYIVEGIASGLALFDYDNDGQIDIYFLNGSPLTRPVGKNMPVRRTSTSVEAEATDKDVRRTGESPSAARPKRPKADVQPRNALYRNNGDWTFTDVTAAAGVGDLGHGLGVVVGDYDNDGDPDIYINNFGSNVLYRNNGDKTFTDVAEQAGVQNGNKVGAGASFFDMEGDGDLDLYVGNYVDFNFENHVPLVVNGRHFQAGPQYYNPVPDTLYRNDGNGTFSDVSESAGIAAAVGPCMATTTGDFDNDGDTDVFVCNDGMPNFLFVNDGKGGFREQGLLAGVACDFQGQENSSMGVDCGDYNNDGLPDLFVTDYQSEMPVLYRGLGGGLFEDATSAAQISNALFAHVHWGTGFVDFDNDSHQDLFVACGHFDRIELLDDRTALRIPNYLMMNTGDGRFVDVSSSAGDGLQIVQSSRGAAFDDLDNDGDVDVVILNSQAPPTILRNDSVSSHHWLQIHLQGVVCNKDAIGSRVQVTSGDLTLNAEVRNGRGYQSHFGTRLYFGLGERGQVDRVEVTWPSGEMEVYSQVKADGLAILKQGTGD